MNGFYNPFMKTPDWGQGMQDAGQWLMMMQMMNRMFPQTKTTEIPSTTPQEIPPPMSGIQPPQGMGQQITGAAPSQMGQQISPQMLMMLMNMLRRG